MRWLPFSLLFIDTHSPLFVLPSLYYYMRAYILCACVADYISVTRAPEPFLSLAGVLDFIRHDDA